MAFWLLKTEPSTYSWDDLVRDGSTTWDGITNPMALKNLRASAPGDEVLIYHTAEERRCVGLARITGGPGPDPRSKNPRLAVVRITAGAPLKSPVTLQQIKADPFFADWELVRLSRLSFVPVAERHWKKVLELSKRA